MGRLTDSYTSDQYGHRVAHCRDASVPGYQSEVLYVISGLGSSI